MEISKEKIEKLAAKFREDTEQKVIIEIDYNDLDQLITEFFTDMVVPNPEWHRKAYESVAYQEWSNYEDHTLKLSKSDEFDQDVIDDAFKGKWKHFSLNDYLAYMVSVGVIPECELLISICW